MMQRDGYILLAAPRVSRRVACRPGPSLSRPLLPELLPAFSHEGPAGHASPRQPAPAAYTQIAAVAAMPRRPATPAAAAVSPTVIAWPRTAHRGRYPLPFRKKTSWPCPLQLKLPLKERKRCRKNCYTYPSLCVVKSIVKF